MAHDDVTQIPPEEWNSFLDELNDTCRGLRARVEAAPANGPARVVAADSPFAGVVDDEDGLVIELAGGMSYSAGLPHSITSTVTNGGPGQTITFETSVGQRTILYLAGGATLSRAVGAAEDDRLTGVGGSAGASGGSSAVPSASGKEDASAGGLVSFGESDDMGGVAGVGGGSLGDRDLSGAGAYDITNDVYHGPSAALMDGAGSHAGSDSETLDVGQVPLTRAEASPATGQSHVPPDVIDGGSDQGVIDTGVDPIEGDQIVPANDTDDDMVEGAVGAQAEQDLDELSGKRRRRGAKPDKA